MARQKLPDTQQATSTAHFKWDDEDAVVLDRDDISDFNEENIIPESPETQAAIRRWLCPTSYAAENGEYRKHLASHLAGTGDWLFSSPVFRTWHESENDGMLCIKGIPGSGKSVVAATLIDRLSKEGRPVLYFFFRQIIDANHTPVALLRDWLAQLLSYSPPLQVRLKQYMSASRSLDSVSMNDLWRDVKIALVHLPEVYCVVDALDEMDRGNDAFLQALAELGRWHPARVKVAVTSRPVASVERPMRRIPMLNIRLDEVQVDEDITTYVRHRLSESTVPTSNHHLVKDAVPGRAKGLFLYAKLAMDAFTEEGADVHQVLKQLPADLNVMYTDLLREHARRSGVPDALQLSILSWVTHATRPLRLLEIAEMIYIQEPPESGRDIKALKDLVRTACGPLLEILSDETVCVIHHSLTEFLNGTTRNPGTSALSEVDQFPILEPGPTHSRLAEACIAALQSQYIATAQFPEGDPFRKTAGEDHDEAITFYWLREERGLDDKALRLQYPFIAYCKANWYIHARKAEELGHISDGLFHSIHLLLSGRTAGSFTALHDMEVRQDTRLHIAAGLGLALYAERLLQEGGADVHASNQVEVAPLFCAAERGHSAVVKLLLAHGADPNGPSASTGMSPLHAAARADHFDTVNLLLAAGGDPLATKTTEGYDSVRCGNAPVALYHTPLLYATFYGHEASTKAILPYLKDAKTVSRALTWAAQGGHPSLVKVIIQHPLADVNAKVRGDTPLFLASKKPDLESMVVLLRAGADPNIMSWCAIDESTRDVLTGRMDPETARKFGMGIRPGLNPLHSICGGASSYSNDWKRPVYSEILLECVSLMVDKGVNVNAKDERGYSALHYAAKSGFLPIVRFLLTAGADANSETPNGETPLHHCFDVDMARALIEEGKADVNKPNMSHGITPLLSIGSNASLDTINLYLEHGADPEARDHRGRGAMHQSIANLPLLEALLATGVSPNFTDNDGMTALHLTSPWQVQSPAVSKLISAGADLEARDNQGRTAFYALVGALGSSTVEDIASVIKDLVGDAPQTRLHTIDFQGRNLLFACIKGPNLPMMKHLVAVGLDPKTRDYAGNTLWHYAFEICVSPPFSPLFDLLLELGVDLGQRNHHGRLPLHLLFTQGWGSHIFSFYTLSSVDAKDNDGIRPLHIAVRFSVRDVVALLEAGASPTEPTHEGMTPLHVAARFRQPNVIGILLEAITNKSGKEGLAAHLNNSYRTRVPTALHLACQSGQPESVALLLAAGANPERSTGDMKPPLMWCIKYEAEEALWEAQRLKGSYSPDPLGIKLDDSWRTPCKKAPLTGLEDILDSLVAYGADMVISKNHQGLTNLDSAIRESYGCDYTTECLLKLERRLEKTATPDTNDAKVLALIPSAIERSELIASLEALRNSESPRMRSQAHRSLASMYRRGANEKALLQSEAWKNISLARLVCSPRAFEPYRTDESLFALAEQHEWELIERLCREEPKESSDETQECKTLYQLISLGLHALIQRIATKEEIRSAESTLQTKVLARIAGHAGAQAKGSRPTLIAAACRREAGNMPMLRLFVEDYELDVNARSFSSVTLEGAIHGLCAGEHWWQVAEALPYLIDHGADLELRTIDGATPLMHAIRRKSIFSSRVIRMLIEHGADVNAVDDRGASCLSLAGADIELTKLLVGRGATVSPQALTSAIREMNIPVIEALLSAGADGNMRLSQLKPGSEQVFTFENRTEGAHEMYPLYYAASHHHGVGYYGYGRANTAESRESHLPVIGTLLEHGADPLAKFMKWVNGSDGRIYEECTILHDLLEAGQIVHPFLDLPDIDVDCRDSKGRTLLLAACRNPFGLGCGIDALIGHKHKSPDKLDVCDTKERSFAEILLGRGASPTATDLQGMNALHHILAMKDSRFIAQSVQILLSYAPELARQTDSAGETPLHYALRRVKYADDFEIKSIYMLLDAGADVYLPNAQGDTALHLLAPWLASGRPPPCSIDEDEELSLETLPSTDASRDMFIRFLSLGLPINSRNPKGETPAFVFVRSQDAYCAEWYAATGVQTAALKLLDDAGADFSAVNAEGETMLHALVSLNVNQKDKGATSMIAGLFRSLLDRGVDVTAEDNRNRTCLDIAAAFDNQAILKQFEKSS